MKQSTILVQSKAYLESYQKSLIEYFFARTVNDQRPFTIFEKVLS